MTIALLICVEQGPLENQAVLLCRSLRRFGGTLRDTPVYTFQPRRGPSIQKDTLKQLSCLGATHSTETLNADFREYGVTNKIFVCSHAEKHLKEEVLVFVDSDTVFCGEPTELLLADGRDVALRPADSHRLNSTGSGGVMDEYWRRAYHLFGFTCQPFVTTEIGKRVRAFFSGGLIAVRRSAGLFGQWESDFRRLVAEGRVPPSTGLSRMDEVALAITVIRAWDRAKVLDGRYNYLIYRRGQLMPPWNTVALEEVVHAHYRRSFYEAEFLSSVRPALPPGEVRAWLERRLPSPRPPSSEANGSG